MTDAANQTVHSVSLSTKQKSLLDQFRSMVEDLLKENPQFDDDDNLLRWIKAREWDLKKAEKMLRDHVGWRKSFGTDKILEWDVPEVFRKYSAGNYFGYDKEGHPIWYELTGMIDMKGLIQSATRADIIKYRIYTIEHLFVNVLPEASRRAGRKITQSSTIFDMEGMNLRHLSVPAAAIYKDILPIVEANYPESLRTCYVINAPSVAAIFYNIVKPFLAEDTRSKVRILGSNWKEELLKDFDAEQLPVHWGGTATDPDGDPFCKSRIGIGGKIPESYYLKNVVMDKFDMNQFTTVTISNGQCLQLDYSVDQTGCVLRWNFWTESKDLAFGVFRRISHATRQKVDEMETLVPTARVSCHLVPETGSIECLKPGTYVVRFDNTYSWINTKKLSYAIEVLLPDADHQRLLTTLRPLVVETTDF